MSPQRWTRERAKSGPCDTYLGRYQLILQGQRSRRWMVRDKVTGEVLYGNLRTMRAAHEWVEQNCAVMP